MGLMGGSDDNQQDRQGGRCVELPSGARSLWSTAASASDRLFAGTSPPPWRHAVTDLRDGGKCEACGEHTFAAMWLVPPRIPRFHGVSVVDYGAEEKFLLGWRCWACRPRIAGQLAQGMHSNGYLVRFILPEMREPCSPECPECAEVPASNWLPGEATYQIRCRHGHLHQSESDETA